MDRNLADFVCDRSAVLHKDGFMAHCAGRWFLEDPKNRVGITVRWFLAFAGR
jgi:hypothetical protein